MASRLVRTSRGRVRDCSSLSEERHSDESDSRRKEEVANATREETSEMKARYGEFSLRCLRARRFCWFLLMLPGDEESSEPSSEEEA
jgi:hypothetical protein